AGEDVVVVWGERLTHGSPTDAADGTAGSAANAARALLKIAGRIGLLEGHAGAGLLQVPSGANGRGLREIGVLPSVGPGFSEPTEVGRGSQAIAHAAATGEVEALHLLHVDPVRDFPDRALWTRALERASGVVAHATFLTDGLAEH